MQSLADAAKSLREKLEAKAAEIRERDPRIAQREAEVAEVRAHAPTMLCPICGGYSFRCEHCGGFGLVCPDCRGMRWVKRDMDALARDRVVRCPTCTGVGGEYDPEREQIAIGRVFEQIRRKRQREMWREREAA